MHSRWVIIRVSSGNIDNVWRREMWKRVKKVGVNDRGRM